MTAFGTKSFMYYCMFFVIIVYYYIFDIIADFIVYFLMQNA